METLYLSIIFGLSCLVLSLLFLIKRLKTPKTASYSLETTILHSLPIPCVYKTQTLQCNKAFTNAFGTQAKSTLATIDGLPKKGCHMVELIFDNGISKSVQLLYAPLFDEEKNPLGYSVVIVDISALQKSKEHLLVQKERMELSLEALNAGLWDWNVQTEHLFFSKQWRTTMGYRDEDRPNTLLAWLNLVHPKDMAIVNERLSALLEKKSDTLYIEHRLRNSDPIRWVEVHAKTLLNASHKPSRVVGTLTDITERKKVHENEQQQFALFRSFFDHFPSIAFIKTIKGKYLYINLSYQRFLGFASWQGKSASDLFDARSAQHISESERLAYYEGVLEHTLELIWHLGVRESWHIYKFPIETTDGEKVLCGFSTMINKSFI